jgi:single-stranded-DNA-specific exonuclease
MPLTRKVLKIPSPDIALQKKLSCELSISPILAQVLINRGIKTAAQAQNFLRASLSDLHSPEDFPQMRKAVELARKAGREKSGVLICGDYDADGVTALCLVKETLARTGIQAKHYLPHRVKDGYGLNQEAIRQAKEQAVKLVITVDCGVSNRAEIEALRRSNIEVIVTDHHEPPAEALPPASALINPKVASCGYKFRELAGVGVAFKLCQAVSGSPLSEELDIVSLGTVADVVPLFSENRAMVKEGLKQMQRTRRPGLRALMQAAGIEKKRLNSVFVSFIIAPRINASGRIDSAEAALQLLLTQDKIEAEELAKLLESRNRQRQQVEQRLLAEAEELINREVNFKEHKAIVVAAEGWHQGVLGVAASKLADKFWRPAIVISLGSNACRASGRSVGNFHLFRALKECGHLLQAFGGHAHAAGMVISKEHIGEFRQHFNRVAAQQLSLEDLLPTADVDMELSLADLNEGLIDELEQLEPFGCGNREPLFYTAGLKLKGEPQVLARQALKFWVTDGANSRQVIGFGMAGLKESLSRAAAFNLVYQPRCDSWQGVETLILEAKEIFFRQD